MTNDQILTEEEVLQVFRRAGAYLKGHFQLTSGLHSDTYLEKARILEFPRLTGRLCAEFARRFAHQGPQVVLGPAMGGIILAFETARQLPLSPVWPDQPSPRCLFAEREAGQMALRRGFRIHPGERVLVVEDIVTTGGSVREVVELVQKQGGELVGVGVLADRSGGRAEVGSPYEALVTLDIPAWEPSECPLCAAGEEIQSRGSRNILPR